VRALVSHPGRAGTTGVEDVPAGPEEGTVPVRTLEVGVCGTDREIADGLFGAPPAGEERLVVGHELLGIVEQDVPGFARGDLVTATVRRSCGHCGPCLAGAPDACASGDYRERGIMRLHGFARDVVHEHPEHLVRVPRSLGRLGVLAEPASICARGIRHAMAIGGRQPWSPERALVLGAGAIGMISTTFLRLAGLEVWAAAREPADAPVAGLVRDLGASYESVEEVPLGELRAAVGGFDLVVEATVDAQAKVDAVGMLRRGGVACLLGIDGRPGAVGLERRLIGVDVVLENRAVFGSVNANRVDWLAGVDELERARRRWPEALERFVGLRVPLERWEEAFAHRGVKATLVFEEA